MLKSYKDILDSLTEKGYVLFRKGKVLFKAKPTSEGIHCVRVGTYEEEFYCGVLDILDLQEKHGVEILTGKVAEVLYGCEKD